MSPEEQFQKVVTLVTQLLNVNGVSVDQEALTKRFSAVDLRKGEESLIKATRAYLSEDSGLDNAKVESVLEAGQAALKQAMPGLGIEAASETAAQVNGDKKKPAVEIEDVAFWKAGLVVSRGARPVQDLSTFEELEPKL